MKCAFITLSTEIQPVHRGVKAISYPCPSIYSLLFFMPLLLRILFVFLYRNRLEDMRNAYKILIGVPEGKRLLGRPRHRWKDSIIMDLREIEWKVVDWIHLAQDRDQW
jgi:hypothetical protein